MVKRRFQKVVWFSACSDKRCIVFRYNFWACLNLCNRLISVSRWSVIFSDQIFQKTSFSTNCSCFQLLEIKIKLFGKIVSVSPQHDLQMFTGNCLYKTSFLDTILQKTTFSNRSFWNHRTTFYPLGFQKRVSQTFWRRMNLFLATLSTEKRHLPEIVQFPTLH